MSRGRALGPGRLRKRGKNWVLEYTSVDRRRQRKVLGTDKRVAERRRQEIVNRRNMELDGLAAVEGQTLHLDEILDLYLEDLRPRVSERHYANVSARLQSVLDQLDGKRVRNLRPMDLVRIRSRATAEGASNRTANLLVDRVRSMLNWAVDSGLIASNPVARMKRLPQGRDHQKYKRRAMSDDEIGRFLAASEEDDEENDLCAALQGLQRTPQTPWWKFLLETGCRYGEARQALWGDIDLQRRLFVVRSETAKSGKQRVIPLNEDLVQVLTRLKALHETVHNRLPAIGDHAFLSPEGRPHAWPTTNVVRVLDRLLIRANIPKLNSQGEKLDVHALRHCFASRLARNDVALIKAQRLLGHSDPSLTSRIYSHVDAEDLRDAVETLRPKDRERDAKEAR